MLHFYAELSMFGIINHMIIDQLLHKFIHIAENYYDTAINNDFYFHDSNLLFD